ncbi:hypothetical protein [Polyangium aurulentum]|uniref:hypothetical protein n=1 Tax=Polyangium aurulentum TaxID=2567896 RepID=UPI00197F2741|nr:hypothetical protein [Polyangium aurulentum]UQA57255.1 hypothetical protein E8A73_039140 [Polyangium aurulentum]
MGIFRSHWRAAALAFAAVGAGGCGGYTSDYVPPQDGRARVVWDDDRAVAVVPQAAPAPCMPAVRELGSAPSHFVTYGGPRTYVVWRPGIVVVASGRTRVVPARPGRFGPRVAASPVSRTPARPTAVTSGSGSSTRSSGGKSGNVPAEVAAVMAVAALITLPAITLGLALGRPEPSEEVAAAIDQVNAFNDLARVDNSPCAAPPEPEEAPAEEAAPPGDAPPPAQPTPPVEEEEPPARELRDDDL